MSACGGFWSDDSCGYCTCPENEHDGEGCGGCGNCAGFDDGPSIDCVTCGLPESEHGDGR